MMKIKNCDYIDDKNPILIEIDNCKDIDDENEPVQDQDPCDRDPHYGRDERRCHRKL